MKRHEELGLPAEQMQAIFRTMALARALDERANILYRQGKIAFTVTGVGHEGAQLGAAAALRPGYDAVLPYYRDTSIVLSLGMTARDVMLGEFARADDPSSGGRQMPKHWGASHLNIITASSPVATQITHAAGLGLAAKIKKEDRVVFVSFGDGAVSRGDFHEGLNFAAIHKLPVIFFCQNNLYAISVPFEKQSSVPDVADRAAAYNIPGVIVDGTDIFSVYEAAEAAVQRAREGHGPTLIEAKTYRLDPHTTNDDDRKYRSRDEVEQWRQRDPLTLLQQYVVDNKLLSAAEADAVLEATKQEALDAAQFAEAAPAPTGESALLHVYAEEGGQTWQ